MVQCGPRGRLIIHPSAVVNNALFNTASGNIIVDEYAFFGHGVSLLTGTHDTSKFNIERQKASPDCGRDIRVRRGAWIASNATILGPSIIGEHAVVCAGAVVTRNVPDYSIVAGVPARMIKKIEANVASTRDF